MGHGDGPLALPATPPPARPRLLVAGRVFRDGGHPRTLPPVRHDCGWAIRGQRRGSHGRRWCGIALREIHPRTGGHVGGHAGSRAFDPRVGRRGVGGHKGRPYAGGHRGGIHIDHHRGVHPWGPPIRLAAVHATPVATRLPRSHRPRSLRPRPHPAVHPRQPGRLAPVGAALVAARLERPHRSARSLTHPICPWRASMPADVSSAGGPVRGSSDRSRDEVGREAGRVDHADAAGPVAVLSGMRRCANVALISFFRSAMKSS